MPLTLRPDGTFTSAALPPHVGTAAIVVNSVGVVGAWPAHGTWTIGPGHPDSYAESVIFTVDCGAPHIRCTGHPRVFELQLETNSPQGGGGPALFYYLDRTRDLNNQYPSSGCRPRPARLRHPAAPMLQVCLGSCLIRPEPGHCR